MYSEYTQTNVTLDIEFLPRASNYDRFKVTRKDEKGSSSMVITESIQGPLGDKLSDNPFATLFIGENGVNSINHLQVANWPHVLQVAEQAANANGDEAISPFYLSPGDPVFPSFAPAGAFRLAEKNPVKLFHSEKNGKSYKKVVFSSENKSRITIYLEIASGGGGCYTVSGIVLKWSGLKGQVSYLDEDLEGHFADQIADKLKKDDDGGPKPGGPGSGSSAMVSVNSAMLPYQAKHVSELLSIKHWNALSSKGAKLPYQAKHVSELPSIKHWDAPNLKGAKLPYQAKHVSELLLITHWIALNLVSKFSF